MKQMPLEPIGWQSSAAVIGTCKDCDGPIYDASWRRMFNQSPEDMRCDGCLEKEDERREEEQRQRRKEEEERQRLVHLQRKKETCGIGARFLSARWEDYHPVNKDAATVKKVCQEYADTFSKDSSDLVLIGSCGTGKNMLISLIGMALIDKGFNFQYTTAMRLVRAVKDSWRDKETTEQEVINSFSTPDLLCIDEIGVQFGSATEQLFITEVINNRYEDGVPTALITNLTMKQVEEVLGTRAVDRFHERGKFLVFNWESYRRRKC